MANRSLRASAPIPMMSTNKYSLPVIYGLLLIVGITGGIGDILLYKWAKTHSIFWLAMAYGVWLCSLTLLGLFLRIEHFTFSAALVLATMIHLIVGLLWSFFFTEATLSSIELAGLILGIIAVILLEVGRSQISEVTR